MALSASSKLAPQTRPPAKTCSHSHGAVSSREIWDQILDLQGGYSYRGLEDNFPALLNCSTAKTKLIIVSQNHTYPVKLSHLQKDKARLASHPLFSLAPYLDSQGLMQVGGRLQKAGLLTHTSLNCSWRAHTSSLYHHYYVGSSIPLLYPSLKCFLKYSAGDAFPARRPMPGLQKRGWGSYLLPGHTQQDLSRSPELILQTLPAHGRKPEETNPCESLCLCLCMFQH